MSNAIVRAEVVFLSPRDGGRQQAPVLGTSASYRPHVVVQDRDIRQARIRPGNVIDEEYLGVTFIEARPELSFGVSSQCLLRLDYYPKVDYAELLPGASFTVREGAKVVGHGLVLERDANPTE
jgi:hypothetical protein